MSVHVTDAQFAKLPHPNCSYKMKEGLVSETSQVPQHENFQNVGASAKPFFTSSTFRMASTREV